MSGNHTEGQKRPNYGQKEALITKFHNNKMLHLKNVSMSRLPHPCTAFQATHGGPSLRLLELQKKGVKRLPGVL